MVIQAEISIENVIRHMKKASQFFVVFNKSFDAYFYKKAILIFYDTL